MDIQGEGFTHIDKKFPYKSEAKLKQGIFVGPEIRKLVKDEELRTKLNAKTLPHGKLSNWLCKIFW